MPTQSNIFKSTSYTDANGVQRYGVNPADVEKYDLQQRLAAANNPETYTGKPAEQIANELKSRYVNTPLADSANAKAASILSSDAAIDTVNKQKQRLDELSGTIGGGKATTSQAKLEEIRQRPEYKDKNLSVYPRDGVDWLMEGSRFIAPINDIYGTSSSGGTGTPGQAENGLSLEDVTSIFGNNLSGIKQNSDGTYTPTAEAWARAGYEPPETEGSRMENDIQRLDDSLVQMYNEWNSYNVEQDPEFQDVARSITDKYERMRDDMKQTNYQRERAYKALGYRGGSAQFAGAINMGILGEELRQGNQRIADITSAEQQELSAAKQAFKSGKYADFSNKMNALDKIRDNKREALEDYNKKLAEAAKVVQDQAKFNLDYLKYELDVMKTMQTDQTKEYQLALDQGFTGSFMDYKTWKQQMETDMPTSFKEFELAGGQQGTGMTYLEFIKDKGEPSLPTSYREWELAGGIGTGKTYGEWLLEKQKGEPSATQFQAAGFASRIQSANTIIDELDEKFTGKIQAGKWLPEALKSEDRKLLEQAQRNFINAVLRRESGAAIADSEFKSAAIQYFPQPGDTKDVLDQKKANRELVMNNMIREAGDAFVSASLDIDPTRKFDDWYVNDLPENDINKVNEMLNDPELGNTEEERKRTILEYFGVAFNKVGSDTNSAITTVKVGNKDIQVSNEIADKIAKADREMFKETGQHININQSYRTREQQAELYRRSQAGEIGRAAPPGKSFHETGLAIDVSNWKEAEKYLRRYGLLNELADDKGHFSFGEFA